MMYLNFQIYLKKYFIKIDNITKICSICYILLWIDKLYIKLKRMTFVLKFIFNERIIFSLFK